ncbi:septum site-determining protein MinC [Oleispira antarctica]|uniref:Probable septum site-determining protein MinC n=1 Tax=Oleispira antarctica TaxID=188908 RepID=A0A1Y5HRG1_OLEAN|nr:septum site-determining protein MinC [Oleispira antarctica]
MAAFNLKAGLNPITTLLVQTTDLEQIQQELRAKIEQAPKMFIRLPCIFDFIELEENIDLPSLYLVCHEFGMLPIGVKNAQDDHHELLEQLELADFGKGKSKPTRIPKAVKEVDAEINEPTEVSAPIITEEAPAAKTTVHKFPVRSGQQLTAEGDLIIFGLVSTGAEVLAGGSIQIFGPLRGRALAGIKGNSNATISCQSLEAELVAIAGEYKLFENSEQHSSQASLIQLDDGRLNIDSL